MITTHLVPRQNVTSTSRELTELLHTDLATSENPTTRRHHVATLIDHLRPRLIGGFLTVDLDHRDKLTALWLRNALPTNTVTVATNAGRILVRIPARALDRYGYRVNHDGATWDIPTTAPAMLGAARGALHAGAILTTTGLHVATPDSTAAHALTRHLARIGAGTSRYNPTTGLVSISRGNVPAALCALHAHTTAEAHHAWDRAATEPRLGSANADRTRTAAAAQLAAAAALDIAALSPELAEAIMLRRTHPNASLAELAAKTNPPSTKDVFAGRMRRALAHAQPAAQTPPRLQVVA